MLTALVLTNQEQLLIELVNRARANPSGEAALYGIGLNSFDPGKGETAPDPPITATPKQPLAPTQILIDIANAHSQDMIDRDFFAHISPAPTNKDAADRAGDAGYPKFGVPPKALVGENIAVVFGGSSFDLDAQTYLRHQALFISASHRQNMLHDPYEEIGTGIRAGTDWTNPNNSVTYAYAVLVTENFGIRNADPLITGVVYTDTSADSFYSIGEGIVGGTITAQPTGGGAPIVADIATTGGYAMEVPTGTYTVTADVTVGGVPKTYVSTVVIGSENKKVDFETNSATEIGTLSLDFTSSTIWENDGAGATTATVTRTGSTAASLEVTILTGDSDEAVPQSTTVTINAGSASAPFTIDAVDETTLDGDKSVTFTVSGPGVLSGDAALLVRDDERPYLPLTVQEGGSATPTFSWTAVTGATHYVLWVDSLTTGASKVIYETNVATTSYTPLLPIELGSYRAWVQARNATVSSVWSGGQTYHVRTKGNITGPGDGSDTTPTFTWDAIAGADVSDLWVNNLSTNTSQALRVQDITGNNYTPTTEQPLGRYQAWIRSIASDLLSGYWSTGLVYRIDVPPTITGVTAVSLVASPTASWNAIDGAAKYEVFVRNLTTGANPHLNNKNVLSTSLELTGLTAGKYRLWVRAADAKGTWYSWSSGFDFSFNAAPTPTGPVGTTTDTTPTFTWTPTTGATRYDLWVSNLTTGQSQVVREQNLTGTTFTPTVPLVPATYRIWIRAFDNSGNQTVWSSILDFTVVAAETPAAESSAFDQPLLAGLPLEPVLLSIDKLPAKAEAPSNAGESADQSGADASVPPAANPRAPAAETTTPFEAPPIMPLDDQDTPTALAIVDRAFALIAQHHDAISL